MQLSRINLGLTIFVALSLLGCSNEKKEEIQRTSINKEPVSVEVSRVKESITSISLRYSGVIEPESVTPLSFSIPGTAILVNADEGDFVKKGAVLARLDPVTYQNSYDMAKATEDQAVDAHNRLKAVYEKGSLPEIKWQEIQTKVQQAQASARIAAENLRKCALTAPRSGLIGRRAIEPGSNVTPNLTVLEIVDIRKIYVKISVPENEIARIRKGQTAKVNIGALGKDTVTAKVAKIGVMAHPVSKTYEVKLEMDNSTLRIKPGMACDVVLDVDEEQAVITIPIRAVQQDAEGKTFVYTVDETRKKAQKQPIQAGLFLQEDIQVLSGLQPGQIIVENGGYKLSDKRSISYQM